MTSVNFYLHKEDQNKCVLCERQLGSRYMEVEILHDGLHNDSDLCEDCFDALRRHFRADID